MAESGGFEPPEALTSPVFKTGPFDQLWQLSTLIISGANGENRTHTPKRERDFKSRASTSSATLAHHSKKYILKWSGIIIKKILFVKTFNKNFFFF